MWVSPGGGLQTGSARQRRAKPETLFAFMALTCAAACTTPLPNPTWTLDGEAFGTRWTVQIRGPEKDSDRVRAAIEAELDAVDRSMSNWRPDSELSRLNASDSTDPLPISDPLARVLESALRVHEQSRGAFDITVGPLLRLFGFGPGGNLDQPAPSSGEFEATRSLVGSDLLSVERESGGRAVVHRQIPDVEMDLSGIAKGYAVDRVSAALTELGLTEHLVEVGGEIQARGEWTAGVQDPSGGLATRIHRSFPLRDLGMATSGGYRNFRAADGEEDRFWTHILDPRTGRPVERRSGSVTVLADSCLEADAWATALYVLGPDAGRELAEARGLAAFFLTVNPDGTVAEAASSAFAAETGGRTGLRLGRWAPRLWRGADQSAGSSTRSPSRSAAVTSLPSRETKATSPAI